MELELDRVGMASVERERELPLDQRLDSAALIDRRRELHDGVVLSIEHGPRIELLGSAQVARLVRHDVGGLDGARNCRQSTLTDRANICRYRGPEQLEVTQAVVLGDRRVHGSARSVRRLLKHQDSLLQQVTLRRSLEDVRQRMGCVRATHGAPHAIRCIDRSREISSTHEHELDARHSLALEALASYRARESILPLDRLILVDEHHRLALGARASRPGLRWLELLRIIDAC